MPVLQVPWVENHREIGGGAGELDDNKVVWPRNIATLVHRIFSGRCDDPDGNYGLTIDRSWKLYDPLLVWKEKKHLLAKYIIVPSNSLENARTQQL